MLIGDNDGNGVSGWAGYVLGKMDAERGAFIDQRLRGFRAHLQGETRISAETYEIKIAELRQIIAARNEYIDRLNAYIQGLQGDRARLREWSEYAEHTMAQLRVEVVSLNEAYETQRDINELSREHFETLRARIAQLEVELASCQAAKDTTDNLS